VNHNAKAIGVHAANHRETRHLVDDVRQVDPIAACTFDGQLCPIELLWMSPDCTHFSVARGGKPVDKGIRSLADVLIDWLAALAPYDAHPRMIALENVREFKDWGPVLENGKPCPDNKGLDFRRWVKRAEAFGYTWHDMELRAADYGAPTTRLRLFGIFRRDGEPILVPQPTHAPRDRAHMLSKKPWKSAGDDVIDWSQPVPSIFDRKRPLAPKTRKRIAKGIDRFVISSPRPFIVPVCHTTDASGNTAMDGLEPLRTVTSAQGLAVVAPTLGMISNQYGSNTCGGRGDPTLPAKTVTSGGHHAVVNTPLAAPYTLPLTHGGGDDRVNDPRAPLPTVTSAPRGETAVAVPYLTAAYGEREGQAPRARDAAEPYPTVVPRGNGGRVSAAFLQKMAQNGVGSQPDKYPLLTAMAQAPRHYLVAASMARQFGSTVSGRDLEEPAPTVMVDGAGGKSGVVASTLTAGAMLQGNGDRVGRPAEEPVTTLTGRSTQQNLMAVSLDAYYETGTPASATEPLRTITGRGRHGITAAFMEQANTGLVGHKASAPVSTIIGKGCTQRLVELGMLPADAPDTSRRAKVLDFLWEHFGAPTAEEWADPLATKQSRLRFGLVVIDDVVWQIADVGMRMLTPRELFNAQGFPPDYIIEFTLEGVAVTKTEQTSMAGNSVSPAPAEALLRANLTWMDLPQRLAA
jgi:DNA (cytosine-5)-methyltransferase 1